MNISVASNQKNNKEKPVVIILWVLFFCYAACIALMVQKVILPILPKMNENGGLFGPDSIFFDSIARQMAEKINSIGWTEWSLYPAEGATGNVAVLGALYAVFGYDPAVIIPVNAALHATGGILIYQIVREVAGGTKISELAGMFAAALFVIFPSALNWYGQLHKDGYIIAGFLFIILAWLMSVSRATNIVKYLKCIAVFLIGMLLITMIRPYMIKMILVAHLILGLSIIFFMILQKNTTRWKDWIGFFIVSTILIAGAGILPQRFGYIDSVNKNYDVNEIHDVNESHGTSEVGKTNQSAANWHWRRSQWLPQRVDRYVETAAGIRANFIRGALESGAKSMIDAEIQPNNSKDVLIYLPRALQIALFAPFPNTWLASPSIIRWVSVGETLVFYFCFSGLLLLLRYSRTVKIFITIYFSLFFLCVNGFVSANIGTLYRVRYGYIFLILALGVLGWFMWMQKRGLLRRFTS
jgi:hypothetical protein